MIVDHSPEHVHAFVRSKTWADRPHPDIVREWCVDCDYQAARFDWSESD
jgi:hypothetical protein